MQGAKLMVRTLLELLLRGTTRRGTRVLVMEQDGRLKETRR